MACFLCVVLASLPWFSSAIVVNGLLNTTQARSRIDMEQSLKPALIQEHAVIQVGSAGKGLPFVATSVQLSLMQLIDPVKEKMGVIKKCIKEQLKDLQKVVNETKAMPDKALEEFATRFSDLFQIVQEKLQPITSKLGETSPAIDGIQQVLRTTGYLGAADTMTDIMHQMSLNVHTYQKILHNATQISDSLRGLGKKDRHQAGPRIQQLKVYLDKGNSMIKTFGDQLSEKAGQALALLSKKLEVDPTTFSPVQRGASDAWLELEESSSTLATGLKSSAQMLPLQLAVAVEDTHSGAAATSAAGAFLVAVAALAL